MNMKIRHGFILIGLIHTFQWNFFPLTPFLIGKIKRSQLLTLKAKCTHDTFVQCKQSLFVTDFNVPEYIVFCVENNTNLINHFLLILGSNINFFRIQSYTFEQIRNYFQFLLPKSLLLWRILSNQLPYMAVNQMFS